MRNKHDSCHGCGYENEYGDCTNPKYDCPSYMFRSQSKTYKDKVTNNTSKDIPIGTILKASETSMINGIRHNYNCRCMPAPVFIVRKSLEFRSYIGYESGESYYQNEIKKATYYMKDFLTVKDYLNGF